MRELPQTLPRFLWYFCKNFKLQLIGMFVVAMFWALTVSLTPYSLKLIIDSMIAAELDGNASYSNVWFSGIFYVFITLLASVCLRLYDFAVLKMFPFLKSKIIDEVFSYLETHSFSFFHQNFAGNLASKVNDIAKGASSVVFFSIDQVFNRVLSLLIGAITMYFVHPRFAALLLAWSVTFIVSAYFLSKASQKYSEAYSNVRSSLVGRIVDSIANILNVKLFAREEYERQYLQKSLDELVVKDCQMQWFLMKVKTYYVISISILTFCMMWLLIHDRFVDRITVGDAALILTLTSVLIRDIFHLANNLAVFTEEVGNCKQALSIITSRCDIFDQATAPALTVTEGKIVFDQVQFEYYKGQQLFVNKSVIIQPGTKVGLVGLSGGGKTTFVNLILRFFDVNTGKIFIDGQDISKVTQKSLRSQIAYIPQDLMLFHRTIMENIRYGRLDASDEEVIECSCNAHCHEFINSLKNGYQSLVGERGVKLSGGQRQRIAIARAMLKDAPILIMDEATSSLDSSTERDIQESLSKLMQGKTTIVIAHRLSTLFHMDRILVFEEGKIIEDGTHQELLQLNGHYKMLWNKQMSGVFADSFCVNKEVCVEEFHSTEMAKERNRLTQFLEQATKVTK